MAVIDLREDPGQQFAIASAFGQGIAGQMAEIRRARARNKIVSVLSDGIRNGLKGRELRQRILQIPNAIETEIGQEVALRQSRLGRYWTSPYQKNYWQARAGSVQPGRPTPEDQKRYHDMIQDHLATINKLNEDISALSEDEPNYEDRKQEIDRQLEYNQQRILQLQGLLGYRTGSTPSSEMETIAGQAEKWLEPTIPPAPTEQLKTPESTAGVGTFVKKGAKVAGGLAKRAVTGGSVRPPTATAAEGWDQKMALAKLRQTLEQVKNDVEIAFSNTGITPDEKADKVIEMVVGRTQIAYPRSEAEYDSLPAGTPYIYKQENSVELKVKR